MKIYSRTFSIRRYTIAVRAVFEKDQAIDVRFAWSPDRPEHLTDAQLSEYTTKRDALLQELAQDISAQYPHSTHAVE